MKYIIVYSLFFVFSFFVNSMEPVEYTKAIMELWF